MKKLFLLIIVCAASNIIFAQTEEDDWTSVNQYGQQVASFPVEPSAQNNILVLENKDRGYKFWFDSRVQVDMAYYHNQINGTMYTPDGTITHEDAKPYMPGGISLRRVRFAVKAEINKDWYGEIDFNMANGTFGLQDAYIQYNGLGEYGWQLKLGNFKEDFSMEYTTSSRFITFMERPMCVTAFNFTRRLGFQVQWQQLNWLRMSAGVTGQEIDNWMIRHNIEEAMKRGIKGSGPNYTGKVVFMPWGGEPNQGLHLGYNFQRRSGKWISDDVDLDGYDGRAWHAVRIDSRNATAMNRTKYFDTDWIRGVKHSDIHGYEFAGYYNSFRFGSEFIMYNAVMDPDLPAAFYPSISNADLAATYAKTKQFYGFYVQATYLLFGGKYRYNVNESEFTQPTRGKNWGDIELKVRYDYLDLNNNFRDEALYKAGLTGVGQLGGSGQNITLGTVWWVNNNVRITVDYMFSDNDRYANNRGGYNEGGRSGRPTAIGIALEGPNAGKYTGNPENVDPSQPYGVKFNTLQARVEIAF